MDDTIRVIIKRLQELRKIPQFVFFGGIEPDSTLHVRKEILNFLKENKDIKEIDFIIQSPGGSPDDAYRIIRTLRKNFETVNIIVPFWVKSAATLLCLGGSKIIMNEFGEFGPLDMQLKRDNDDKPDSEIQSALIDEHALNRIEVRAQELYHTMFNYLHKSRDIKISRKFLSAQLLNYVSNFYIPLLQKIDPYQIGVNKRYLEIGEKYAERILIFYNHISKKDRIEFVDYLVNGCPDHGYVIDYDLVSLFLKNVKKSSDISDDYDNNLTLLSNIFIEGKIQYNYIGFLPNKEEVKSKKLPINQ